MAREVELTEEAAKALIAEAMASARSHGVPLAEDAQKSVEGIEPEGLL